MRTVQVLTMEREIEWEGDSDDLLQSNADLSEVEVKWVGNLEVGQEFRAGGSEGPFFIRRLT